jgi:adenine phosphoribosyltransferase
VAELLAASLIRDVPDFPKPGIVFKDITPVLEDYAAFAEVIERMSAAAAKHNPDKILGIESRGFVFGAPMALKLRLPFVMARKLGKLPFDKISQEYALEYGTNTVEMHRDSVSAGDRVCIVDDLLATGGTALAAARLVESLGGTVSNFAFMVNLTFLPGAHTLADYKVDALIDI